MDRAEPGALPHLRDAPDRQVNPKSNLRTALVLLSIAAVFFAGVIVKRMMFP